VSKRLLFVGGLVVAVATAGAQPYRGGENYYFYEPDTATGNGYGIVTDYHLIYDGTAVSQIINTELSQMVTNGQRTLAIDLFFAQGTGATCPTTGSPHQGGVVESASGSIPANCMSALNSIIYSAYSLGFQRVRIRFFPANNNNPFNWTSWQNVLAAQNWSFIHSVVSQVAYGVDKYDLGNEEIYQSPPASPYLSTYTNWIWKQWYSTYGLSSYPGNDTTGFSVPCDDACVAKLETLDNIYNVGNGVIAYPPVLDLHLYGSQCPGQTTTMTVGQQYTAAIDYLAPKGRASGGFVLGEACYDSQSKGVPGVPIPAQDLYNARNATGTIILYITQWVAPFGTTDYLYSNWSQSPYDF